MAVHTHLFPQPSAEQICLALGWGGPGMMRWWCIGGEWCARGGTAHLHVTPLCCITWYSSTSHTTLSTPLSIETVKRGDKIWHTLFLLDPPRPTAYPSLSIPPPPVSPVSYPSNALLLSASLTGTEVSIVWVRDLPFLAAVLRKWLSVRSHFITAIWTHLKTSLLNISTWKQRFTLEKVHSLCL